METRSDRTAIVALVAGAIALLLGLCLGALGGGVAGYLLGRQAGGASQSIIVPERAAPEMPVVPVVPGMPETPLMPGGPMGRSGAFISEVIADSPAQEAGLQVGDMITGVNNVPVDADHPLVEVLATFKPGERVALQVWRVGETRTVNVTLGANPSDASLPYLGIRYVDMTMERRRQGP